MNYLKHYVLLMRKGEARGWSKKTAPCYVEGDYTGVNNPGAKAMIITRINTGEEEYFGCVADAVRKYGIKNIRMVLMGRRKSTKGFTARYPVEGEE